MEIRPIRNETDHKAALAEVERLSDAEPGTPEFDRLDVLATLIEAYEAKVYPIDPPDPVNAMEFEGDDLEPFNLEEQTADVVAERLRSGLKRSRIYLHLWQESPTAKYGYTSSSLDADLTSGFDKEVLKHLYDSPSHVCTTLIFIDDSGALRLTHGGEFPPYWDEFQSGWEQSVRIWFIRS